MHVEWLTDLAKVEQIVNSADVGPFVLEGSKFVASPLCKYLGVYAGEELVGVYIFIQRLRYMWEVHTCLLKQCRGKLAIEAGRLAMAKLFSDVDLECLTTFVPSTFLHVIAYTKRMGFTLCGIMPKCFYYETVQDCFLYAITREEANVCLLQQ